MERLRALAAAAPERWMLTRAGLRLDAPLRDAPKLLAMAGNYRKHVVESGFADIDEQATITPQIFMMPASTALNAPGGVVLVRPNNVFVDYEVELAVVVGRGGRDIPPERALEHVFGYSVLNDVSERRLNKTIGGRRVRENDPFFDWLVGKWFDGFAPFGPELVTKDEIPDPHNLAIRLWVNDELRQDGNTGEMIFRIPEILSYISSVLRFEPGDIIATGTPQGVGMARGISLAPGDRMRCEIEGLGVLENPVQRA
jgi:2-keto-4-pentenoate hydratase/2-oxohepta-3-ene-1,7-dioic acid hydratase in catechol pathway